MLKVIGAIVAAYDKIDPADSAYFEAQKHHFEAVSLAPLRRTPRRDPQALRRRAGRLQRKHLPTLGQSLGLKLLTPYSFTKAIAEGTDVSAQDKETVDRQAQERLIKVWVFNSQNVTPDVQQVNAIARAQHIPIATVAETLSPATDSFQQWQDTELQGLIKALHAATGR